MGDIQPTLSPGLVGQSVAVSSSAQVNREGCPPYSQVVSSGMSSLSSCFFSINSRLPIYEFRLHAAPLDEKDDALSIHQIDVIPTGGATTTQVLIVDSVDSSIDDTDTSYARVEDFNFDGYKDFSFISSRGATGNSIYTVWLFNPQLSRFVLNKELSDLMSPVPDPKTKTIRSFSNTSAADWDDQTYIWKDGRLMLVHEVSQNYEYATATIRCTTNEYSNGRKTKTVRMNKECPMPKD
jgi:hypothetical protein